MKINTGGGILPHGTRLCLMAIAVLIAPGVCKAQGYTITTVAGGSNGDSAGVALKLPLGLAIDANGNLYITTGSSENSFVSKVSPDGTVNAIVGSPTGFSGFSGDGGPATNAQLGFNYLSPAGIAVDSAGNLYIADTGNSRVRKVSTNGVITTYAGGGSPSNTLGDGGPATSAVLSKPEGLAVDSGGNLYIVDNGINLVRKVKPDGTISTVAGCLSSLACASLSFSLGDGGPATNAALRGPTAVAVDSSGNLYIADTGNNRIRKVSTDGTIATVAGSAAGSYQGDGGQATSAGLNQPTGVAVDSGGNIYIDDNGDYRIRKVTPDGIINTIAGNGAARQFSDSSGDGGPATSVKLSSTNGIALGMGGTLYIADWGFGVRLLTPAGSPPGSPPSIKDKGIVSASAFGQFASIAPGSWIEIYGSNLATNTRGWAGPDFNGINAPTSLDGTKVTIGGQSAFVDYISPGQINAQVPSTVSTGPQPVVVSTATGASSAYTITVNADEPGLLAPSSFNIGGKQYVAALFSDGATYVLPAGAIAGVPSKRAQAGDTITLYGIGFGPVVPDIPAGQIVQRSNALAQSFHLLFGQTEATVSYAGLAPSAVGLYQFNVVVPSVPANDAVPLTFTLGGVPATQTLYTAVQ